MLGVFAQLGTVDQEALSRVLAANYRSMLVVLIVEDADCRSSLEQLMSKSRSGLGYWAAALTSISCDPDLKPAAIPYGCIPSILSTGGPAKEHQADMASDDIQQPAK